MLHTDVPTEKKVGMAVEAHRRYFDSLGVRSLYYKRRVSWLYLAGTVGPDGRDRIVFRFQYIKALMLASILNRRKNRGHLHTLDK